MTERAKFYSILPLLILLACLIGAGLNGYIHTAKELCSDSSGRVKTDTDDFSLLLLSSCAPFYQVVAQSDDDDKIWRTLLLLFIVFLFLSIFCKTLALKYSSCRCYKNDFIHSMLVSLLLGGRAPPISPHPQQ